MLHGVETTGHVPGATRRGNCYLRQLQSDSVLRAGDNPRKRKFGPTESCAYVVGVGG